MIHAAMIYTFGILIVALVIQLKNKKINKYMKFIYYSFSWFIIIFWLLKIPFKEKDN